MRRPLHPSAVRATAVRATAARTLALAALAGVSACSTDRLTTPNLNSPSTETGQRDPGALQFAVTGVLIQNRANTGTWTLQSGILGREHFNYTQTEGRNTSGYLITPQDPAGFGAGNWAGWYTSLRNLHALRPIIDAAPISDAQKEAARGFSRTIEGYDYLGAVLSRHNLGIVGEIRDDPLDIAPFIARDSGYALAAARLNDGAARLRAAGAVAFPFVLPGGYAGFTTPATFLRFNRALAARVEAYRGSLGCGTACYQRALTALSESFLDASGALTTGVYQIYSTGAGDALNPITTFGGAARVIVAHPSLAAERPLRADGQPDNRFTAKTVALAPAVNAPGTGIGIATGLGFRTYPNQDSPLPVIRNEELILLRAEARYFTGDQAGALADLNDVRTRSGGLAPIAASAIADRDGFVTELLAQRRLSLLQEGHRWVDVRRFGRIQTLPRDLPNHVIAEQQVIPQQECLNRRNTGNQALFGPGCP